MAEEAYVIIEGWSSQCSACKGNADPNESSHIHGGPNSGYSAGSSLGDTNGCGVEWTKMVSNYYHPLEARVWLREHYAPNGLPFEFVGESLDADPS